MSPVPEISNNYGITSQHDISASSSGKPGHVGTFPGMGRITLVLNPSQALPRYIRDLLAGQGRLAPPPSPALSADAGQRLLKEAKGYTNRQLADHLLKALILKS